MNINIKNPSIRNYEILKKYEAGISLKGSEIKSIVKGSFDLKGAYLIIKKGEMILINSYISKHQDHNLFDHDPLRNRKILMHKKEIIKINIEMKSKRLVLVPIKAYSKNSLLKIEIGLGRSIRKSDKRDIIKNKDLRKINNI